MLKRFAAIAVILALTVASVTSCGPSEVPDEPVPEVPDEPREPDNPVEPEDPQKPEEPEEPEEPQPPVWSRSDTFNENEIVFSLGAISDTHIGNGYGSEGKFTSALAQMRDKAAEQDALKLADPSSRGPL